MITDSGLDGCRASAEHPAQAAAGGAEDEGAGQLAKVPGKPPAGQAGGGKQHGKVEASQEKAPEKAALAGALSHEKAPQKAGEHVDAVYGQADGALLQVESIEEKGQGGQKEGGQEIGYKEGADGEIQFRTSPCRRLLFVGLW